jgi:two-component system sensor histidine kinase RegB
MVESPRDGAAPARPASLHLTHLSWLVRLRWGAVIGQIATIAFVEMVMGIRLPLPPLGVLVGVEIATNVALAVRARSPADTSDRLLAATMALDIVILTGLLFFTGGPFNPFSFLYLVHIALAAVVLRTGWTWALVGLSLLSSGGLFYGHVWLRLDPKSHAEHMQMHMQGMWIACAVAAGFIVYFVTRVRRALAEREAALSHERALVARSERLAALATLSAGAAHELATPLGTIAVAARELERAVAAESQSAARDDVRLIREQVERCRTILAQMAADAGNPAGEPAAPVPLGVLVEEAIKDLPGAPPVRVEPRGLDAAVLVPRRAITQVVRAVVKNAQEASRNSGAAAPVEIAAETDAASSRRSLRITDRGPGMTAAALARAGEPFFTTKEPGRGMGLGLFLARTVLDRIGGRLEITSRPGAGTSVLLQLPDGPDPAAPAAWGGGGGAVPVPT